MKAKSYKIWTEEETKLLINLFVKEKKTKNEICIILNRPYPSIKKKLKKLNLLCSKEQSFKSRSVARLGNKNPMYGKPAWSKGLTKNNNESLLKASKNLSNTKKELFKKGLLPNVSGKNNPMFGKKSWCKGLTIETSEILRLAARKTSITKKESWKKLPPEIKEEKILKLRSALKLCMDKKPRSSIEIKIENYLKDDLKLILNEDYIPQLPKDRFIFDFYFPKLNCVLECQGDYYHANPNKYTIENLNSTQKANVERDKRKIQYLLNNNINHLFIWEYDINKKFNETISIIKKFLYLN